jgi:hypothetical protein
MQSQSLRAWKLGLSTSHGVPSRKYDMDAYMATLSGGEAWGLCCEVRSSKKLDPTLNPSPTKHFLHKKNSDPILMIINHIFGGVLRLTSWDFALHVGTC